MAPPIKNEAASRKIVDALLRLTPATVESERLAYASLIPTIAREIQMMRRPPSAKNKASQKRIEALAKSAARTCRLLEKCAPDFPSQRLEAMREGAAYVKSRAEATLTKRSTGAQSKKEAGLIAVALKEHFERITGRKATVVTADGKASMSLGSFIRLVAEVFAALGLKASAEYWARAVISGRTKDRKN